MEEPLLSCEGLAVGHGGRAVASGIGFVLHPGEGLAVVGENGAGKSTLLRTLLGLQPALAGEIRFGGALSAGYTFMLSKHFNLELGIGGWAGVFKEYGFYSSPEKYFVREEGRKKFIYPDQVSLSFAYVF